MWFCQKEGSSCYLALSVWCVVLTHCSHNRLVVACICWLFRGGQQLFDRNWYVSFWEGLGRGWALDYSLGGTINRVFFAFCNIVLHIIVSMLCFVLLTSNPQIILLFHRRNAWPCGGSSLCENGNEQNNNHHYKTCVTQMNNNTWSGWNRQEQHRATPTTIKETTTQCSHYQMQKKMCKMRRLQENDQKSPHSKHLLCWHGDGFQI